MDNSSVKIAYKLADGKRICLDVSIEVRDLLEQADRQIRSQRRLDRRRHTEYVDGLTDTTTSLPTEDFADQVIKRDSYQRLYAALERLPETQRRRVLLHFAAKLTYHQIAASLTSSIAIYLAACRRKSNNPNSIILFYARRYRASFLF